MIFLQELLEMFAALRSDVLLGFGNCAHARKVPINLVVKVFAICDNDERPITGHLAQNLLRKENHRIALAASLRVPENSQASTGRTLMLRTPTPYPSPKG